jgi:glycerophosphoryl diester phosphodiesterase
MPGLPAEPIPTLEELASLLPDGIGLAVELKSKAFFDPARTSQLIDVLHASGVKDRTVALSFHRKHLYAVQRADPALPLGLITLSTPYPVGGVQMVGPFWPLLVANPVYVWWAHLRGQLVCPLDPTPEPRLWYYRFLGCDAVLSDDPGTTSRALGRRVSDQH